MQIHDDRGARPFGKRRSPDEPGRPAGLFGWAVRTAAILGFAAVLGAYQLARLSPSGEAPVRVALDGRPLPNDPDTTGAITTTGIARSAEATRLDPCRLATSDRLRP